MNKLLLLFLSFSAFAFSVGDTYYSEKQEVMIEIIAKDSGVATLRVTNDLLEEETLDWPVSDLKNVIEVKSKAKKHSDKEALKIQMRETLEARKELHKERKAVPGDIPN